VIYLMTNHIEISDDVREEVTTRPLINQINQFEKTPKTPYN
jgi:hypothetical protein